MQSSFLYVLMVARFCARQVNLLVLIIGSNDILDLDMTQRLAVGVIINIVLLDHIKMMAVTVAQI